MPEADIGEQGTGDAVIYVCKNKKGKEIYTFRYYVTKLMALV